MRNPVVPAPRHMEGRVELEYAIGEGVAPAEIIEEPAVDPGIANRLLDVTHTLLYGCGHRGGHLIVAPPTRQ